MKATTKTLSYIKRMITMEKWKDSLPPISSIAKTTAVSPSTVRKAVRILEVQRVVENNGSLGYTIIPKKFDQLYKSNKTLYYLAMLNRNIKIAELLDKGGKVVGNFVFLGTRDDMTVANIASGNIVNTSLHELKKMTDNVITLESMLGLNGTELRKAKRRYHQQKKLMNVKDLVFKHRKELGL